MSEKYNKIIDSLYNLDYEGLTIRELEKVELSIQNELDDVRKSLRYKQLDKQQKNKQDFENRWNRIRGVKRDE